jgi:hypothetical protein
MSKSKKTKSKKSTASHVTKAGTQKFQCNGPSEWAPFFAELAERIGGKGTPPAIGIRYALAFAVGSHDVKLMTAAAKEAAKHEGGVDLRAVDMVAKVSGAASQVVRRKAKLTTEAKVDAQRKAAKKEAA